MTVEANRDESLICMERAREALRDEDYPKAERMLHKAKRLDPRQDITHLLKEIHGASNDNNSSFDSTSQDRSYSHDDHYEESNLRGRKPQKAPTRNHSTQNGETSQKQSPNRAANGAASRSKSGEKLKVGVHYTKEEVSLVERIRHCKDYYEILNVPKTSTEVQIKKEYRRMALLLHPDKCRAPHATEAFKALGNAYAVLSDKTKRQQYDAYGAEGPPERRSRGDYFEYDYNRGFEADITPEEIFNMFFGGGPSEAMNRRRHHFHQQQQTNREDNPYGAILQLLPLVLILFLGALTQLMVGDPAFSLSQSNKYPVRRETAELRVPYFVKKDFDVAYKGRLKQVEDQVEDEYINQLRLHCYKEQNQKETMKYRARLYGDTEMFRRAEALSMPNCKRLQEIYSH